MRLPTRKLVNEMMKNHLNFIAVDGFKNGYLFSNTTNNVMSHYIIIYSSQKELHFEVNLSSTILGKLDNRFGGNLARHTCRLPNLREERGALLLQEVYYGHDGSQAKAKEVLNNISKEINRYAIPWFEMNQSNLSNGSLLQFGVEWVNKNINKVPVEIEEQIEKSLKEVNYSTIRVKHELLNDLKHCLRKYASIINAPKREKQAISTLGIDLLLYGKYIKTLNK